MFPMAWQVYSMWRINLTGRINSDKVMVLFGGGGGFFERHSRGRQQCYSIERVQSESIHHVVALNT